MMKEREKKSGFKCRSWTTRCGEGRGVGYLPASIPSKEILKSMGTSTLTAFVKPSC